MRRSGYSGATEAVLNNILIYGLRAKPGSVSVNSTTLPAGDVVWNGSTKVKLDSIPYWFTDTVHKETRVYLGGLAPWGDFPFTAVIGFFISIYHCRL